MKPLVTITTKQQIAHIKENQNLFDELHGYHRSVQEYFDDYDAEYEDENGFGGLYICICSDLELKPRGKK
jgi:hypothetical protein